MIQLLIKRPYNRIHTVVAGIDDQWSVDLIDMVTFVKYNDGCKFIFEVINIFSKYLWLRKLKDKINNSVAHSFVDNLKEGRKS